MAVVEHIVHVHMAMVHLHAGMVHPIVHVVQDKVVAGKGIGREDKGKGERGRCDPD